MKLLLDANVLISAAELGDALGADPESINNWICRGVISRAPIGGRHLPRHRLFSPADVYKAALINELVSLRIPPSPASDAVNELWKDWDKDVLIEEKNIYAVIVPSGDTWSASLCWQSPSGGPLYRLRKRQTSLEQVELPKRAFAVIPLWVVFADVTKKLLRFLSVTKKNKTKDTQS